MTYYFLLGSALAVAGLGCLVRRRSDSWGQIMIVAGCLGCVGAIAWQVRQTVFPAEVKGPDRGQAVVAYYLANQVLSEVGDQRGTVYLFFPPEAVFDEETVGTYSGTFRRVLSGFTGLKVQPLTLTAPRNDAKAGRFPTEAFQQALSNAPAAVAYVSFAGVPADIERLRSAEGRAPAMFVFDPWSTTNWLTALKKGRVRAVIVPRPGVRPEAAAEVAGEPSEVFSQLYLRATPKTADETAAQLGVK